MPDRPERLPHLFLRQAPHVERFTSPQAGGGTFRRAAHDRRQHGQALRKQLEAAQNAAQRAVPPDAEGIVLEFKSEPGYELALQSLDVQRSGSSFSRLASRSGGTGR